MWVQQRDRVKRRYQRFSEINAGIEHTLPSDFYEDDVRSFFTDCDHLKDWLKNYPASGVFETDVEMFVHSSQNLRICGDLANGSKHAVLTKPKVGAGAKVKNRHFEVGLL